MPPSKQAVQPVAVPSVQEEQERSHDAHVPPAAAYLPLGHVATHAPPSKYGVLPVAEQEVQAVDPAAEHSSHDAWQLVQL